MRMFFIFGLKLIASDILFRKMGGGQGPSLNKCDKRVT